jgi:ABC-type transporter Mla maintaining outer membrane lipid asymmetry ATPase subunit MlaF
MMHEGEIIFNGTPAETQNTDDAVVRQFVTGSAEGPIKAL